MKERKQQMKATGIIRRIDDLGRIVIPKELRNKLGVGYEDCIEFYTHDDGSLTIKRFDSEDYLVDEFLELGKEEQKRFLEKIQKALDKSKR